MALMAYLLQFALVTHSRLYIYAAVGCPVALPQCALWFLLRKDFRAFAHSLSE
jgi:hypothetical protein